MSRPRAAGEVTGGRGHRRGDRAQMDGLWAALIGADADGDARRLAAVAWDLYGRPGQARAERDRLRAAVRTRAARPGPAAVRPAGADARRRLQAAPGAPQEER